MFQVPFIPGRRGRELGRVQGQADYSFLRKVTFGWNCSDHAILDFAHGIAQIMQSLVLLVKQ